MALYPAVLMLRRKDILKKLEMVNATTEESAKKITEIGLFWPTAMSRVLKNLVDENVIKMTEDNRYYLVKESVK